MCDRIHSMCDRIHFLWWFLENYESFWKNCGSFLVVEKSSRATVSVTFSVTSAVCNTLTVSHKCETCETCGYSSCYEGVSDDV